MTGVPGWTPERKGLRVQEGVEKEQCEIEEEKDVARDGETP